MIDQRRHEGMLEQAENQYELGYTCSNFLNRDVIDLIHAYDQLLSDAMEMQKALDQSNRQWRMYAENDCYHSLEQSLEEDPENVELKTLLACEKSLETFTKKYGETK